MLTFYGNISYIWYFNVLDSMPVFRVQVYENLSEMTYSCYQTIPHHILHLLDHKKVKFVHGPKMALMRPRPLNQMALPTPPMILFSEQESNDLLFSCKTS